jgi:predicted TIM-barrel fold metal-dependent hydrolase
VREGGRLYELFEQHANLYADLSAGSGRYALQRDPEHAVRFLQRFSDRLLFGRDYYGQELNDFVMSLSLPQAVLEKIYHENVSGLLPA